MATTASCAKVIPFLQVRQPQPVPLSPPYGDREYEYYGYNYNNIRARAREIVGTDARQVALAQVSQAFEACLGRLPGRCSVVIFLTPLDGNNTDFIYLYPKK